MHLSVLQCVTTLTWIATLYVVVRAKQGELVEANSKFALSLYGNVCDDDANLVISPYSVSAAMAMTYAGSAGRTREELRRVLGYSRMRPWFIHKSFRDLLRKQRQTSKVYTLYVANRIFANRRLRINYTYQRIAMKYYGSSVKTLRFNRSPRGCVRYINRWVSRKTGGMIKDLLRVNDISRNTDLVLTSAIYFKSEWSIPFDSAKTTPDTFCLSAGDSMQVDMMVKQSMFNYGVSMELGCHVVELPYKGDASMYILLPWAVDGLSVMQQKMSINTLNAAISSLTKTLVNVYLPKFTMTSDIDLRKALTDMGLTHLFKGANLKGISNNAVLSFTKMKHSAAIKVNERGTEASAATAVVTTRSFGQPFIADRPFSFIIRERSSGSILFMGHVKKPPKATSSRLGFLGSMQKKTDMLMKKIMYSQRKKFMR